MFELSIKVSNEEKKSISKHLVYRTDIYLSEHDETLSALVNKAKKEFPGEIQDVKLTIHYFWGEEEEEVSSTGPLSD